MTFPPLDAPEWKDIGGGLKVWDVTEGTGTAVPATASVTCHYTGWTTDGKKFDSSLDSGKPITFPLSGVIQGWQKGIPGMKPGGTRRLSIPGAMAYGPRGIPGTIPPNATLVFEVQLVK
ncbi:FKBP-type peptidyl-prolyl cis-trans isomerase [Limnoglobus roseus]|uniref:Peptidyl-prolyl cis-trans isomerase n=1 Tax=Limnoglobus roseus TaxID=2598579 RepID=A0A5C1A7T0_9BACT|nr:FKBP-type peptidyl-prolyl cis-trans isomerase [Limnoglobus roseus]QEL15251.1 FKBP-type peptidyl-prolyl cis-trans isomerase [Limnoglobus roseus]